MKMAGVIFVVFLVLSAAIEAQENKTIESSDSVDTQDNATDEAKDIDEPKFVYKARSVVSQSDGDRQTSNRRVDTSEVNDGSKTLSADDLSLVKENDGDEEDRSKTGTNTAESEYHEPSIEIGRGSNDDNEKRNILDILNTIMNVNKNENKDANRRLDIENNGDVFPDFIDIDNPKSIGYNQGVVENFKSANMDSMGYGARLDMKGRSGDDLLSPINMNDRLQFRLANTRHGLFINPGFFTFPTPPPITFSKIDSRDLIPMGRLNTLNSLPFRRLNRPAGNEETIRRVDPAAWNQQEDTNAYPFEPEENIVARNGRRFIY